MSDPLAFDDSSPRLGLPYLFAGQSQKEVFVNEAHSRLDTLIHCAIESVETSPPLLPEEGQAWMVGNGADGAWLGRDTALALFRGGEWQYVTPVDGMRILDRSTGQDLRYLAEWKAAEDFPEPSGGTSVDSEARVAIGSLIAALRVAGILPSG